MTDIKIALLLAPIMLFAIPANSSLDPSKPAPALELEDFDGVSVSLEDFADRIVVLEWFGHLCEFTWSHYRNGHMSKLQEEYTGKGVIWLTIDSNTDPFTREEMRERADEWGMKSTAILKDPTSRVARSYGATVTPQIFVIHHGRIVYQGAADDRRGFLGLLSDRSTAKNYIREALDEVLAGQPVSTPETKPYGCAINGWGGE